MSAEEAFDYVIVGAGSAGCVLANRLSADPGHKVLLLEAGPEDDSWKIRMPAAYGLVTLGGRFNWAFETLPQRHMDGRRLFQPRGKGLGGSSSINGMAYIRGHALDYERWVEEGARGWSYAEVLPYFRRAERSARGADQYRGGAGPLAVDVKAAAQPLNRAFLEAGRQAGYPLSEDVNGFQQEGFGRFDMTIDGGLRASAARAYLDPARGRPGLIVKTGALALAVEFESTRASAVTYLQGGRTLTARARREIVLAAGAFASPQLLLLSGIGPAAQLRALEIPILHDLPGVGENLQDHLEVHLKYDCAAGETLDRHLRPLAKAWVGLRWLLFKSGLGASNQVEVGGFIRSRPGLAHPDVQYHFWPLFLDDWVPSGRRRGFCLGVGTLWAKSRGRITLGSPDPRDAPLIDPNYLAEAQDVTDLARAVALTRELAAQPAFAPFEPREAEPGPAVAAEADIEAYVRRAAESAYHPCGTCRMGLDARAVVDPDCRVRGVQRLRVVDASIMPSLISGNLNAPVIMLAEKAADLILGRPPPEPAEAPYYVAEGWQTRQR